MVKKAVIILMTFVILACSYFSITSKAATLGEQKQEVQEQKGKAEERLEYVKGELSESVIRLQELNDTIRQAESDIQSLDKELTDLEDKISDITYKLKLLEQEYETNEKLLEKRIVVMYETGEVTYLEVLFNSANLIDFLSNYYTIQEIVKSDADLLKKIQEEKDSVEKYKKELDIKKNDVRQKKARQEQLAIRTQNNKTLREQMMINLSQEEIELQQKIEEYKTQEAQIEALIQIATNEYEYSGDYTGGVMAWPVAKSGTYITSGYGVREHPIYGIEKKHTGIDIGNAGFGAPVIAAADGVVTMAGRYGGYGNCVIVNHGNGISTLYGHGQAILTEVGKEVKKGDLIMEVGSTGESTGPHLHFEVRVNGTPVDPMPYLTGEKSKIEETENTNTLSNTINNTVNQ